MRSTKNYLAPVLLAILAFLCIPATPALALTNYPVSSTVYLNENQIPRNGVGYNVAVLKNDYSVAAGPTSVLVRGVANTLSASNATAVNDQVTITDTKNYSIDIDVSKWVGFLPAKASFSQTFSTSYVNGTTKTFTQNNQIVVTPLVDGLRATPMYYRTQMSGDRWIFYNGRLMQANVQPNSFNADIVRAQGWELKRADGTPAIYGTDYR